MGQQFFKTGIQRNIIGFRFIPKGCWVGLTSQSIQKECQIGSLHQCLIDLVEFEI